MGLVIGEALSLIPSSLGGGFRGLQITPGPQGRGDPKDPALAPLGRNNLILLPCGVVKHGLI